MLLKQDCGMDPRLSSKPFADQTCLSSGVHFLSPTHLLSILESPSHLEICLISTVRAGPLHRVKSFPGDGRHIVVAVDPAQKRLAVVTSENVRYQERSLLRNALSFYVIVFSKDFEPSLWRLTCPG